MKNNFFLFAGFCTLILSSCGTYHYYPAPVHAPAFANAGEVQVSGTLGITGFAAKGGVAITDNLSIAGLANTNPGVDGYHCNEGEVAMGWNLKEGKSMFNIYGGLGWGGNYDQDSGDVVKNFHGYFERPFVVFSVGSAKTAFKRIRIDSYTAIKINYFMYNGYDNVYENNLYVDKRFTADHVIIEPCFGGSIGGKHVRFETGMGFSIKTIGDIGRGARIFPFRMDFGMILYFGRKFEGGE